MNLFLFSFYLFFSSALANNDYLLPSVHQFTYDNYFYYTVVAISPKVHRNPYGTAETEKFAQNMMQRGFEWSIEQYKKTYPEIDAKFFEEMLTKQKPNIEKDGMLLLFRGHTGTKTSLIGTLRVAYRTTEDPKLPFEKSLGYSYPSPVKRVEQLQTARKIRYPRSPPAFVGDVAEIKNLATNPNMGVDTVYWLFHFANEEYLFETSGERHPYDKKMFTDYYRKHEPEKLANELRLQSLSGADSRKTELFLSDYLLVCDDKMINYYKRLGFQLAQSDPIKPHNYLMRIDRKGLLKLAEGKPRGGVTESYENLAKLIYQAGPEKVAINEVGAAFPRMQYSLNDTSAEYMLSHFGFESDFPREQGCGDFFGRLMELKWRKERSIRYGSP